MELNRGEVWIANMNPGHKTEPGKSRPVLIIQSQKSLEYQKSNIIVLLMTSRTDEKSELRLKIPARDKLIVSSDIMIDQVRTIDISRFKVGPITKLAESEMDIVITKLIKLIS
jgi:mRNA interferase MazF